MQPDDESTLGVSALLAACIVLLFVRGEGCQHHGSVDHAATQTAPGSAATATP